MVRNESENVTFCPLSPNPSKVPKSILIQGMAPSQSCVLRVFQRAGVWGRPWNSDIWHFVTHFLTILGMRVKTSNKRRKRISCFHSIATTSPNNTRPGWTKFSPSEASTLNEHNIFSKSSDQVQWSIDFFFFQMTALVPRNSSLFAAIWYHPPWTWPWHRWREAHLSFEESFRKGERLRVYQIQFWKKDKCGELASLKQNLTHWGFEQW